MEDREDLICAYVLDGRGGGRRVDWDGIRAHREGDGILWLHLQREAPGTRDWLEKESGLDQILCDALLSEAPRPRCEQFGDGILVSLRGVNLNPGADPDDMVGLIIWAEAGRIVTVRRRRLMAVDAVRQVIERGRGPKSAGDFVAQVADGMVERMGPVIADLDDRVDGLEDAIIDGQTEGLRFKLAGLRREAIALRRYIAPQREAMARLLTQQAAWIDDTDRRRLREIGDRILRYVEDLDAARERAQIAQDELSNRVTEQINRNMYVLSIVAAIFLPLSLLTGYLGINVGGIPGEKWPWAFASVGLLLLVLTAIEFWLFRRLKWL